VLLAICLLSEAILLVYDRTSALVGVEAFAYSLFLWLVTRACIKYDAASEDVVLRTRACGWRLYARLAVVTATLLFVAYETSWGASLVWNSGANAAVQRFSAAIGLGYGDTALPNFIVYALIPGILVFALGAKPIELGLVAWRKGSWFALLGACIFPLILIVIWFSKGHATVGLLLFMLVRNFLSNGFSEEFLVRGMAMSHLRALFSKEWGLALQALLFGLLHLGGTVGEEHGNVIVALANVFALNSPTGFFLGLIALRARSIVLPGLIHTTLDTMRNLVMGS
jgi:membrane protease YdiL (CAAX protease family)